MASIFTFGFSGDDIDADAGGDTDHVDDEMQIEPTQDIQQKEEEEQPELVVPQKHTLTEILSNLPSSVSYNTLSIPLRDALALAPAPAPGPTPTPTPTYQDPTINIPRRSLFDVVAQLKAEADIKPHAPSGRDADAGNARDDGGYDYETLIATLESGDDLRSRVYEGGFKTWECGFDLARYLAVLLYFGGEGEGEEEKEKEKIQVGGAVRGSGVLSKWFGERGICSAPASTTTDAGEGEGGSSSLGEDEADERQGFDVIELGAGSAMPSLVLLNHVLDTRMKREGRKQEDLTRRGGRDREEADRSNIRFILCDYNIEVLKLVTGANVMLQLARRKNGNRLYAHSRHGARVAVGESVDADADADAESEGMGEGEGELDNITPPLLHDTIIPMLNNARIFIDFVSGAWGSAFVDLVSPSPDPSTTTTAEKSAAAALIPPRPVLMLSSETIYSPHSLQPFISTVLSLLQRSRHRDSMALVAAKKMYFGVGGGVDEFVSLVREQGGLVEGLRDTNEGGVGRVILGITLPD